MQDFKDILKKSLTAVNEGFESAMRDLDTVTGNVNAAVKEIASQSFEVSLRKVSEDVTAVIYRVSLDMTVDNVKSTVMAITHFSVPSKGYPLHFGSYSKRDDEFSISGRIDAIWELEQFFVDMMNDPDSSLIQSIGFAIRKSGG